MEQTRWIREIEDDPTGALCIDPYANLGSDQDAVAAGLDLDLPCWRPESLVPWAPQAVPTVPLDQVERHATPFDAARARVEGEGGGIESVSLLYPRVALSRHTELGAGAYSESSEQSSFLGPTGLHSRYHWESRSDLGESALSRRWGWSAGIGPERLVLGYRADPYSGQERNLRRSRALIDQLLRGADQSFEEIVVVTESPLILEDLERWTALDRRRPVLVVIPIPSLDCFRCHRMDPRGTDPRIRLHVASRLALEGLRVRVTISPLIPGLTDAEDDLRRIFEAAREAGAEDVEARPLRLPTDRRDEIQAWLTSELSADPLPMVSQQRLERALETSRGGELPKVVRRRLDEKIARLRMAYGFPSQSIGRG